jgi:thymidylate synthase (FAD)
MTPKIVHEPRVYLVGRQSIDEAVLGQFLADHNVATWETDAEVAGEKLVEVAGRLCYMSFARPRPGGHKAYVDHVLESGHGSVTEHAVFNFIVAGVSRSFTHELVRHRAGFGYSQLSQRYVDEGDCEFVVPPALADEVAQARAAMETFGATAEALLREGRCGSAATAGLVWLAHMERSRDGYKFLADYLADRDRRASYAAVVAAMPADTASNGYREWLADLHAEQKTAFRKQAREAARSVLPNATETKIFVTGNVRALRHLVELRGNAAADAEIRRVAVALLAILKVESPALFADYAIEDGSVATPHRKV